ncbi:porin [Variovorax humicola]|uniref:Porin n=1 Tax=Variovorax humicola TaxID=1769758 RepID=A0ABU8VS48_9BURK
MKKSLVALAALAVAGVASAQSSVTLFGVVDAAVSYYQTTSKFVGFNGTPVLNFIGTGDLKQSQWALTNSGYNSSRVGFRGTEDLGGGLAASFWLEAGTVSNDDGVVGLASFARRSTVSLSGGFGELRLGRDYTPTFWNDTVFDPFGTNGVGSNLIFTMNQGPRTLAVGPGGVSVDRGLFGNANYVRASNSVGYFLPPNLGGFYGQVMYAFPEKVKYTPGATTPNVPNSQYTGQYVGGRFGYANGGLDVAASYGESTTGDDYYAGQKTTVESMNLGASYDFGVVKLFGELSRTKNNIDFSSALTAPLFGTGSFKGDGYLVGATVPVGPGLIRVSYSAVKLNYTSTPTLPTIALATLTPDPKADKFAIGYVHNLSKRTALYATAAFVKNKNGLNLNANSSYPGATSPQFTNTFLLTPNGGYQADKAYGYDFGIRHAF